ncbi:MAG: TetR/AcrR family transcriptional regulator [Deltaproteobacteria bacterium]
MNLAEALDEPPAISRRERRKLELRGRILEAAKELFEERGVTATTVAEIAEHADVATKTFFNHFPTKQNVVEELAHAAIEIFVRELASLRTEAVDLRAWLLRFFDHVADSVTEAGPMHREYITEIVHAISSDADHPGQARQMREVFLEVVRDGVARGEVETRYDIETQSELIIGAFYSLMFSWTHLDGYPVRKRARAMARLLGDTLSTGKRNKE